VEQEAPLVVQERQAALRQAAAVVAQRVDQVATVETVLNGPRLETTVVRQALAVAVAAEKAIKLVLSLPVARAVNTVEGVPVEDTPVQP